MGNPFLENIRSSYDSQSRTFKTITTYIINNYNTVPFLSISELAEKMNVSTGSITRYCRFLGYSGFQGMMDALRNELMKEMTPLKIMANAIAVPIDEGHILKTTIESNIRNLEVLYSDDLQRNFDIAASLIPEARSVYIIGMRSAFTPAYYLYNSLSSFMDNVHLLTQTYSDIYDHITDINEDDVLVSIGFSQYTKLTCDITSFFANHGSKIITLTDSGSSPLAKDAKAVMVAYDNYNGFSYAKPIIILNALVVAVGKRHQEKTLETLDRKRELLKEKGVHYYFD